MVFDEQRQPGFLHFAQHRALGREKPALDELLRDGASTLRDSSRADVGPRGPQETRWIDRAVLEEAPVLGSKDGVDEHLRRVGQAERPILFTGSNAAPRQHLAFERRSTHVTSVAQHTRDSIAFRHEAETSAAGNPGFLLPAQHDLPRRTGPLKLTGSSGTGGRLDVSEVRERGGESDLADVSSRREGLTGRIDDRAARHLRTGESSELEPE